MKEKVQLTMKDIAKEFCTSVATVSRALKNSSRISEEKRIAIQTFAREHNFTPNILAELLRNNRGVQSRLIGVIVPELAHYYFSTVLAGIEEEARLHNYNIMVAQSNEEYEMEMKICQSFFEAQVCGVIVSQAKDTKRYDHFDKLIEGGVPLVFYDRICTGVDASRVVVDDYIGAYSAVNYLIETGCSRIAFFGSLMTLEISKNRFNGYKDALLKHGLKIDDSLVQFCDNMASAEIVTPQLFELETPPDSFFAVNDDTAIGILYAVKRLGLRVPDDISICGFTNGERSVVCEPMLTTVEQRGRKVGEEAVDILIDHVEGKIPSGKVEKRIVRTKLIVRGTTR